ncbi:hypothetical protein J542_0836 [Acinetobacter baumannii 299505]|nr:hypothetical protein J542_0836 [Acinetobacter baumannii 299505]
MQNMVAFAVHGGIRHLEIQNHTVDSVKSVHGGIRHLEMFRKI